MMTTPTTTLAKEMYLSNNLGSHGHSHGGGHGHSHGGHGHSHGGHDHDSSEENHDQDTGAVKINDKKHLASTNH